MAEKLRLSSIEGGGNWWITLNWAAKSFRNAHCIGDQWQHFPIEQEPSHFG